jgi:hypothetical protein
MMGRLTYFDCMVDRGGNLPHFPLFLLLFIARSPSHFLDFQFSLSAFPMPPFPGSPICRFAIS